MTEDGNALLLSTAIHYSGSDQPAEASENPAQAETMDVPPVQPPVSPVAPASGPNFCPNCGQKLNAGTNFCPNCGKNLADEKT